MSVIASKAKKTLLASYKEVSEGVYAPIVHGKVVENKSCWFLEKQLLMFSNFGNGKIKFSPPLGESEKNNYILGSSLRAIKKGTTIQIYGKTNLSKDEYIFTFWFNISDGIDTVCEALFPTD